jgi:hypothetical protein
MPSDFFCKLATFVPAAGEAAGPPEILRESIGGAAAPPSAGTNATDRLRRPHNIIIRYYWESGAFSR